MVVTADVPESIRQILWNNWNLHGSLSKQSIGADQFNTGVYAGGRRYPSIEVLPIAESDELLTMEWWQVKALCHVHVWVRPKTTDTKGLSKAKSDRKYLFQEVKRIIHSEQIAIEDVDFVWLENPIYADQYSALESSEEGSEPAQKGFFPVLHTILPVRGRQWHGASVGGIAVNR